MKNAQMEVISKTVIDECNKRNIEVYQLHGRKRNTIAFCSVTDRKRREFEITFLSEGVMRLSTRFIGYKNVIENTGMDFNKGKDPDGRRKLFYIDIQDRKILNDVIFRMLKEGFTMNPIVERI